MGRINSPAKGLDRLNFKPLPKKATPGRMVQVDDVIVFRGEHGALYTNVKGLNGNYACHGRWRWSEPLFEALCLLGVVTDDDRKLHAAYLEREKSYDDARHVLYAARDAREAGLLSKDGEAKAREAWNLLPQWRQRDMDHWMPPGCTKKDDKP
jgi:hypothetical protein